MKNTIYAPPEEHQYWHLASENFNERLPRRSAVIIKESLYSLEYCCPSDFSRLGWTFDGRQESTYKSGYFMEFAFADYFQSPQYGLEKSNMYFSSMCSHPGACERSAVFANAPFTVNETVAQAAGGGFILEYTISAKSHPPYLFDSELYSIIRLPFSLGKTKITKDGLSICIKEKNFFITGDFHRIMVFTDEFSFIRRARRAGNISEKKTHGWFIVLVHKIRLLPQDTKSISIGISTLSLQSAVAVLKTKNNLKSCAKSWQKWFSALPVPGRMPLAEKAAYYKCWRTVRENYFNHSLWGHMVLEALPVYKGLWQWGLSALEWHTMLNPETGPALIKKSFDLFLSNQRKDGYITHAVYINEKTPGRAWSRENIIQTPHFPWIALRYFNKTADHESLRKWYPALKKYYQYLCSSRDQAFRKLHLWAATTSYDTGLDTFPALQRVTYDEDGKKEKFCYPSVFAAERCRYEEAMAKIAAVLKTGEENFWRNASCETLAAADSLLWDGKKNWYGVLHADGELDTRVGVDGLFMPAYGHISAARARLMKKNMARLIGKFGIHTLAPDEKDFNPQTYWRGPAWPKACSLAASAVMTYFPDLIPSVRKSIHNFISAQPGIWECVDAQTGGIARSDHGFFATPGVSSNVGAGELIGSLFILSGKNFYDY